jgi:predicted RNA binding protein YcfA (HicA-like mRNA interferase family)
VKRRLAAHGFVVDEPTGGGSHFKLRSPDGRTYPVSAHNALRTELSDGVLRSIARFYELDIDVLRRD